MKVSQKGLYALQAMMVLARRYTQGAIRIRDFAGCLGGNSCLLAGPGSEIRHS